MKKTSMILAILVVGSLMLFVMRYSSYVGWPFNYYRDYNIAKQAVTDAGCIIEHQIVNEDLWLEEIAFDLRTQSGWELSLFFQQDRDMRQLCYHPRGVLFSRPDNHSKAFTLEALAGLLQDKSIRLESLGDVLRNLDLIVPLYRADYDNEAFCWESKSDDELLKYLTIGSPSKPVPEDTYAGPVRLIQLGSDAESAPNGLTLQAIEFDVVELDSEAAIRTKRTARARYYVENLPGAVPLELVQIPAGKFLMGTSSEEASLVQGDYVRHTGKDFAEFWHEGPPHTVTVPAFFMGKFEVRQEQWRAVAALPRVKIDLPIDPSELKGDQRPVENVSWEEAAEFCARLSRATGRHYRLPTEAEWEYACRAGSRTPFHFGNAISTKLANYEGLYPYGPVGWGISREETTPVGSFPPNALGLYDMHGNVEEFCLDAWHDTYEGAPSDASTWIANGLEASHVLRGGMLHSIPAQIRSASRAQSYSTTYKQRFSGFRVVASFIDAGRK